jgi:hypothetical protein
LELNKGVEIETKIISRTVCLMDATGSMGNLLESGKKTISLVFQRAKQVLTESGANPDCFEFQIAFYRNYGSGKKKILEVSPWVKKPDDLRTFMNQNETSGGQGNEAIEIGLWHANREFTKKPITQIMIIGDAAANTQQDVQSKRKGLKEDGLFFGWNISTYGESYWETTEYQTPTFYLEELDKLKEKKVKIFTFYVSNDKNVKICFEKMATEPKGCQFLNVNNAAEGAEDLLDTIAKVILNDIGGEKFQEIYDKKFKVKSHTQQKEIIYN